MPTVADGVTEVFPPNRIAVRSVPVGEFTNSFAIRPFYFGPDASQWGGLEPENFGPSAADRPRQGAGPLTRGNSKYREFVKRCRKSLLCRLSTRLGEVIGDMARATGQQPSDFVVNASMRVDGPIGSIRTGRPLLPRPRVVERVPEFREPRPAARAPARGRLRSQGGYIDPALLGAGPRRRPRVTRGARSTVSQPRSAQDGPSSNAVPRPRPAVRPLSVPQTLPRTLPGALPSPLEAPRTAPQPRPAPGPAPSAATRSGGRPADLAKIAKPPRPAPRPRPPGRGIPKAAGALGKGPRPGKPPSSLFKPPLFARPPLALYTPSSMAARDPFQPPSLTPVEQPQLALALQPDIPGDRRRARSKRDERCPQRKGKKRGLCQQGYYRETPDGITYTKWSERKCQASSRKKPA